MVNEDGLAELRRRSARVAAVRRFSKHTVHRHSAEGGGCALPALPLAAIQDNLFSEALHGRSACERLAGIKLGAKVLRQVQEARRQKMDEGCNCGYFVL